MADLTVAEIQKNIQSYEDRIHSARLSLHYLPEGRLSKKERGLQQKYRSEIKHCEQLLRYANEGIELRLNGAL